MKPKVLLVDDEPDFIRLTQFNLVCQGFEVLCASNGIEAVSEARRGSPDAIVLDLMLPDMDGFSVCEILRSRDGTAEVPVFILSALDGLAARARGQAVGANSFFRKPVNLRELGSLIHETIARRRKLGQIEVEWKQTPGWPVGLKRSYGGSD